MATVEDFHKIRAPIIVISKIIGAEIWTSEKRFQPASYMLMAHMVAYNICSVYTVMRYSSDPLRLMQIVILFGIALQLIIKFCVSLWKKNALKSFFVLTEQKVYQRFSAGTQEEREILEKTTRVLGIIWKLIAALYVSTLFVFAMWPVYMYYTDGQLVPMFSYEIPAVDPKESIGYVVTMLFHVDIYILGIFGSILADYLFMLLTAHALTNIDLLVLHLNELGILLLTAVDEEKSDEVKQKWTSCLHDHQFATEYLNSVEEIFGLITLVQVFTCVFTVCDALLLVTLTDYYAAFCFLVVIFGELTIYFLLGNTVELRIDQMYACITEFPWNLLNVSQQKEYQYLLARSQRPLMFTILGFAPLNFESYEAVLKMLYQFFVVVMQYLG